MSLVRIDHSEGYDKALCRMMHLTWDYPTDDAEEKAPTAGECGEEVWLVWTASHPLTPRLDAELGGQGITTKWTVECAAGHVLAVSDGEEDAEPFDCLKVLGVEVEP